MRIFSIRHGQVLAARYFDGDVNFPVGDEPITPLGEEQARLTGRRLAELGFRGVILASPYARTLRTAELIAEELGTVFYPHASLREMFVPTAQEGFRGLTAEEITAAYPHARLRYPLPYPWWEVKADTMEDVKARVAAGIAEVSASMSEGEDLLLVAHAASCHGAWYLYRPSVPRAEYTYNCSISLLATDAGFTYAHDVGHLPPSHITSNAITRETVRENLLAGVDAVMERIDRSEGTLLLHIGDTHSGNYPLYLELIDRIRPDILVHTGDVADERKAGRIPEDCAAWCALAHPFLEALAARVPRFILVGGNNDPEEEIAALSRIAEIYPRGTVLTVAGERIYLGHEVLRIEADADADIFLYGHGLTGDPRTREANTVCGRRYFNDTWGPSLHLLGTGFDAILPDMTF